MSWHREDVLGVDDTRGTLNVTHNRRIIPGTLVGGMGNRKPSFSHSPGHRLICLLCANWYLVRHEPRAGRSGTLDVPVLMPSCQISLVVSICSIPLCPDKYGPLMPKRFYLSGHRGMRLRPYRGCAGTRSISYTRYVRSLRCQLLFS